MIRSKFAQIIDTIFLSIAIALVGYVWLIRLIKQKSIAIILSGLFAFTISKIIWNLTKKQSNKHNLKQKELIFAENCINYLSYNPSKCTAFFENLFSTDAQNNHYYIAENTIYYVNYKDEEIKLSNMLEIKEFSEHTGHLPIKILAHSLTKKAKILADNLHAEFLSFDDVFVIMKNKNLFPISTEKTANLKKFDIKKLLISLFDSKKAKHYLGYGVLLIVISLFIPFTFWYCVMGSIFIILSILSLIFTSKFSNAK